MREEIIEAVAGVIEIPPDETAWEWAAYSVDFALNPAYPTEYKGQYDPEFLPMWKECVENVFNPYVREQAIWKSSQAGVTENVPLNAIRFSVARVPRRILYVWGDQKSAEEDFRDRLQGGLLCCVETAARMKQARSVECRLDFPDMTIAGAWPKNRQAFKRNPWAVIFVDEFSTYPSLTPNMIRKRCDTVPFSHICWISSSDPQMKRSSKDDPIVIEFEKGDQREWMMIDPRTGALFRFVMGSPETPFGLKWRGKREDGSWDYEVVANTAHYVTPDGTKIKNKDRMNVVRTGTWVPQNPKAPKDTRSYHINEMYMPFDAGDFGKIAVAFIKANEQGREALRVFVYEWLAEKWETDVDQAEDDVVYARQRKYEKGVRISESEKYQDIYISKPRAIFMGADVQKGHHWYVAREWFEGGDSALIEYGYGVILEDLRAVDERLKANQIFIDNRYKERRVEVYDACARFKWVPTAGSEQIALPFRKQLVNPREGKYGQGKAENITQITFDTDIFGTILLDMIRGESPQNWYVYNRIDREYVKQVCSMQRTEGVWEKRRGHPHNHLWDCEVLSLLCATVEGMYRNEFLRGG
jgi:hypothetical protein